MKVTFRGEILYDGFASATNRTIKKGSVSFKFIVSMPALPRDGEELILEFKENCFGSELTVKKTRWREKTGVKNVLEPVVWLEDYDLCVAECRPELLIPIEDRLAQITIGTFAEVENDFVQVLPDDE